MDRKDDGCRIGPEKAGHAMTNPTGLSNPEIELLARLEAEAIDPFAPGLRHVSYVNPDGPEAAQLIRRLSSEADGLRREVSALNGRVADYRTVAINQGWNWRMCDSYGQDAYLVHRGEHVDACALNAAETRARAALTQPKAEGEKP